MMDALSLAAGLYPLVLPEGDADTVSHGLDPDVAQEALDGSFFSLFLALVTSPVPGEQPGAQLPSPANHHRVGPVPRERVAGNTLDHGSELLASIDQAIGTDQPLTVVNTAAAGAPEETLVQSATVPLNAGKTGGAVWELPRRGPTTPPKETAPMVPAALKPVREWPAPSTGALSPLMSQPVTGPEPVPPLPAERGAEQMEPVSEDAGREDSFRAPQPPAVAVGEGSNAPSLVSPAPVDGRHETGPGTEWRPVVAQPDSTRSEESLAAVSIVKRGEGRVGLRVADRELGPIWVDLHRHGQRVDIGFKVTETATLQLLEANLDQLLSGLRHRHIDVGETAVSLRQPGYYDGQGGYGRQSSSPWPDQAAFAAKAAGSTGDEPAGELTTRDQVPETPLPVEPAGLNVMA